MTPDKIYLYPYATDGIYEVETRPSSDTIEYIRKDALLEWAKETYLNENASAIRKVCYKQLIDKLNAL